MAPAQALSLHVERAIPPIEIVTAWLPDGQADVSYLQHLEAIGGLGTYVWTVSGGTLTLTNAILSGNEAGDADRGIYGSGGGEARRWRTSTTASGWRAPSSFCCWRQRSWPPRWRCARHRWSRSWRA